MKRLYDTLAPHLRNLGLASLIVSEDKMFVRFDDGETMTLVPSCEPFKVGASGAGVHRGQPLIGTDVEEVRTVC